MNAPSFASARVVLAKGTLQKASDVETGSASDADRTSVPIVASSTVLILKHNPHPRLQAP